LKEFMMFTTDLTATFTHAIARRPGRSFVDAITTSSHLGPVDLDETLRQHDAYVAALETAGVDVTVMAADEAYPDATFVEDVAVITEALTVITHPGAESRQGEQHAVADVLAATRPMGRINAPATLEGGDVMRIGKRFFVGLSGRTDQAGIDQFATLVAPQGFTVTAVPVAGCLHLKTGVTFIGNNTLVATGEFAARPELAEFSIIPVADEWAYGANFIAVNDRLLMSADCDPVREAVIAAGFSAASIIEIPMSEFRKVDGGLTCLSLRY
jgi:dimethylargininase